MIVPCVASRSSLRPCKALSNLQGTGVEWRINNTRHTRSASPEVKCKNGRNDLPQWPSNSKSSKGSNGSFWIGRNHPKSCMPHHALLLRQLLVFLASHLTKKLSTVLHGCWCSNMEWVEETPAMSWSFRVSNLVLLPSGTEAGCVQLSNSALFGSPCPPPGSWAVAMIHQVVQSAHHCPDNQLSKNRLENTQLCLRTSQDSTFASTTTVSVSFSRL